MLCCVPAMAEMAVTVLDVGQGDSILVESGGKYLLFDAGPSSADVSSMLTSMGIYELTYFITSHPDADHIGGAADVITTIPIGIYADSGATHTTQTYERMIQALVDKQTPYMELTGGEVLSVGDVIVEVMAAGGGGDNNDGSVVLKLTDGSVTMLLPGDRERLENWSAKIMVVPHHGSAASSVDLVKPEVAIISVGAGNSYGHPAASTLAKLRSMGAEIRRTDQEGDIIIVSDGSQYHVSSLKSEPVITKSKPTKAPRPTKEPRSAPVQRQKQQSNYQQYTDQQDTSSSFSSSGPCDCSRDSKNCGDFGSWSAAQSCYEYCQSQGKGDIHRLDQDKDGSACDSLR